MSRRREKGAVARRSPLSGKFVEEHRPLVRKLVGKRLKQMGLSGKKELRDDLEQEGLIALWKAGKKYDKDKALPATFAAKHVRGAIGRALKTQQGPIRGQEREVRRRLSKGEKVLDLAPVEEAHAKEAQSGIARVEARKSIASLLKGFSKRDRQIVTMSAEHSQGEIAKKFKISKTRVNQVLKRVRTKAQKEAA